MSGTLVVVVESVLGIMLVLWLCTSGLLIYFQKRHKMLLSTYMSLKFKHETLKTNHSALIGMYAQVEAKLQDRSKEREILREISNTLADPF